MRPRALRIESLESRQLLSVVISPTKGLQTSENGGGAVVSAYLTSAPTSNVVLNLSLSNPLLGSLSTSSLTFTPANYKKPQSFRITGQPDDQVQGTAYYSVSETVVSTDPNYPAQTLSQSIKSTHPRGLSPGIAVSAASGLHTTKDGGTASFTIKLTEKPQAPVTVPIATSNAAEGIPNVPSVTFTPDNWNQAQTVTVTGENDGVFGDTKYSINLGPASSTGDPAYDGKFTKSVAIVNKASTDVSRFDGTYVGSYTGTVNVTGAPLQHVNGTVQFSVTNGVITVTSPASGTGTLHANGDGSFSGSGGVSIGITTFNAVFSGVKNSTSVTAGGSWHFSESYPGLGSAIGNGGWTATRVNSV
jgi:hypothetical protein